MIFPKWFAEVLFAKEINVWGFTAADIMQIIGLVLLLFAGLIIFSLGQRKHFKTLAAIITSQDAIWVLSCIGIAVYSTSLFSTNGLILFLSQTFIIAAIAYCQFINLNLSEREIETN